MRDTWSRSSFIFNAISAFLQNKFNFDEHFMNYYQAKNELDPFSSTYDKKPFFKFLKNLESHSELL